MPATWIGPWNARFRRFALSAGPTLVYGFLGIARNKWLAQTVSTGGIGILVQVFAAMNWLGQAAGLGLGLPLTRSVAAARALGDPARERGLVRTALRLALGSAVLLAIAALTAAPWIATALLGSPAYASLVRISSIGIVGLAAAGTLLAVFAGRGDVTAPLTLAAGGATAATALTFLLVPRYGLPGATLAAAVLFPTGCLAALAVHGRRYRTALGPGFASRTSESAWAMARVGIAGLTLGLLEQGTLLVLRAHFVRRYGADSNGLLQAALALSQLIGSLFYTYLASYAFGALSAAVAAAGPHEGAAAARRYTRRQGPALFLLAALFFGVAMLGATPLLHLLYSHRFDPARPFMAWTLLGEYARVAMQVWMLGALPVGGVRLLARISLAVPVTMAAAYAILSAMGMGTMSFPRAYAVANGAGLLAAAAAMSARGITLGRREAAALALGAAVLLALARLT